MSEATMRLTDRLRGVYVLPVNDGAGLLDGKDTFTRKFETPPIQKEAADMIDELLAALHEIKRCNEQYNFGSKLLRIVLPAIAKAEGRADEQPSDAVASTPNPSTGA